MIVIRENIIVLTGTGYDEAMTFLLFFLFIYFFLCSCRCFLVVGFFLIVVVVACCFISVKSWLPGAKSKITSNSYCWVLNGDAVSQTLTG